MSKSIEQYVVVEALELDLALEYSLQGLKWFSIIAY